MTGAPTIGGLDGAIAVVTGGASGIGEAVMRLLEASGARVHIADLGGAEPVDVTDRAALDRVAACSSHAARRARQRRRRPDARTSRPTSCPPTTSGAPTRSTCSARSTPARRASSSSEQARGAIVNVASQAALVSLPQQAAYTAAKGAVAALTRSLAIDWAEHGIRANAVAPGFTRTPMTDAFFENEVFTKAATGRIPLGRILEADEIAGAIVFLASPLARAITGVTLPVDGGLDGGEPALPW